MPEALTLETYKADLQLDTIMCYGSQNGWEFQNAGY